MTTQFNIISCEENIDPPNNFVCKALILLCISIDFCELLTDLHL